MMLVCLMELDLMWYIPFYLVNGLGGGSYVLLLVLLAVLIDTTRSEKTENGQAGEEDERTRQIRICTGLCYFLGAMGPLAGGYLTQDYGHVIRHDRTASTNGTTTTFSSSNNDDDFIHGSGRHMCTFCHGGNYQLAHLFFFGTK